MHTHWSQFVRNNYVNPTSEDIKLHIIVSFAWNITCCIWNGQVETEALSRFNRTATLTRTRSVGDQVRTVLFLCVAIQRKRTVRT